MKRISFQEYPKEPVVIDNLSVKFMKQSMFVPLSMNTDTLRIAMADPDDFYTIDALKLAYGLKVEAFEGREDDIVQAIERLYGSGTQSLETIIEEAGRDIYNISPGKEEDADHLRDLASEAPIIRLVNRLIYNAVEVRASDIHFEPFEDSFKVRYRIDGVLHEVESPPDRLQAAVISMVKIMAKLDIAERRIPQDGRIKVRTPGGKEMEFRVSILPTLFGEKVVMRLLDKSALKVDMSQLGFEKKSLETLSKSVHKPYGMVLVTGPTGSGKTTTLYSALMELNDEGVNISTAEDPVEFSLPGVNQVLVREDVGLTFAAALRSFLRQDPDIILVGEIRDFETAEIAVKAALTGHLVLSTLHTNDAPSTLTRLLNMGIYGFLVASSVNVIVAQRLVRKICPFCRRLIDPDNAMLAQLGVSTGDFSQATIYEPVGCPECHGSGYKGRLGVYEVLEMTSEMQEYVLANKSVLEIRELAIRQGMMTLRESALQKLQDGVTSVQEVLRVTV